MQWKQAVATEWQVIVLSSGCSLLSRFFHCCCFFPSSVLLCSPSSLEQFSSDCLFLLTGAWKVKLLLNSFRGRQPPSHGGVLVVYIVFDLVYSLIFFKNNFCLVHSLAIPCSDWGLPLKQKTPLPRVHTQTVCTAHVGQTWKNWFMW